MIPLAVYTLAFRLARRLVLPAGDAREGSPPHESMQVQRADVERPAVPGAGGAGQRPAPLCPARGR